MFVEPWRGGPLNFTDFLWEICIPGSCLWNQAEAQNLLSLRCKDFKIAGTDNNSHSEQALVRHMGQDETFKRSSSGWTNALNLFTWVLISSALWGCTGLQDRYVEKHVIRNLTIVFLDEDSLREQWKQVAGRDAVRFKAQMNSTVPLVHTVQGFYDFTSNTLYCPKWNFEVCGHELHHAALGHFHASD